MALKDIYNNGFCNHRQQPSLGDQVYIKNDMNLKPTPTRIIIRISPDNSKLSVKTIEDNSIIEVATKDVLVINRADIYRPAEPIGCYINSDTAPEVHDLVIFRGGVCVVDYTSQDLRYAGIVNLRDLVTGEYRQCFIFEEIFLLYSPTKDKESFSLRSALITFPQKGHEKDWHNWSADFVPNDEYCKCILLPDTLADVAILVSNEDTILVGFHDNLTGVLPRCYLDKIPC